MKKIKKSRCDKSYERSLLGYRSTYLNPFIVLLDKVKKQTHHLNKTHIFNFKNALDIKKY